MAWVRVDDKFTRGPKVKRAARLLGGKRPRRRIIAVWLEAMSYCNLHLTDGVFPDDELSDIDDDKPSEVFEAMAHGDEDLGAIVERGRNAWVFRNYGEYQPLKADVEAKLERDRNRKKGKADSANIPRGRNAESTAHPYGGNTDSAHTEPDQTEPIQPEPDRPEPAPRQRPAPRNGTHYTTAENDAWAAETGVTLIPRGQIRKPRTGIDQSYRHRSCIGGGSWASCARGVCVPPNLARQWMDQGFDEAYCAKLTADYLDPITAGTPLESDGYRLWRGVWSAVHQPEVPRAPTAREKNTPMAVLERNWETTLTQFPSHSDMMAEALADERRKQDERNAQRLLKAGAR